MKGTIPFLLTYFPMIKFPISVFIQLIYYHSFPDTPFKIDVDNLHIINFLQPPPLVSRCCPKSFYESRGNLFTITVFVLVVLPTRMIMLMQYLFYKLFSAYWYFNLVNILVDLAPIISPLPRIDRKL